MAAWLVERGVLPGSELLDAGCGTGRYATELARRGYVVHGVDLSAELIETSPDDRSTRRRSRFLRGWQRMEQPAGRYDAILCRGVLNDFVDDDSRAGVSRVSPGRFGLRAC